MARTAKLYHRVTPADPIYNSRQVAKLINRVMQDGKKALAQRQVYEAFELIKQRTQQDPVITFEQAVGQITPQMEVRSRRVGGAAYQVPMPVRGQRGLSLAVRWLVTEAKKRPSQDHHTFAEKLAAEIVDAAGGQGGAVGKKLTFHKMAEANKAFAHFRW
ncbi:MAG: 30S ribosomal protein S7 [Candidatus Chisholmbacteria bacterium]|nr:30S ribosomal protein S7 [Candidatus Chisholmbacteria bacterium]